MPQIELGGKVIATQSGANNPVLASNVVMDNVNLNNVTFPAGHVIGVDYYIDTTNSGVQTVDFGFGNVRSIPLLNGQKVLIFIFGGGLMGTSTTATVSVAGIQHDTSNLTTSSQGSFAKGGYSWTSDGASQIETPGIVSLLYTASANLTLYYRPAVCHWNSYQTLWVADSGRPINIIAMKIEGS